MAEEIQYTTQTALVTINTANNNLDGSTGVYTAVITAASNGTKVRSLWIKAVGSTTAQGMIRFFIYDGANKRLFAEVPVPIVTQSATNACWENHLEVDLDLKSGNAIYASTEIGDTFNIIAEGLDWSYYSTEVRTDTTRFTANTGLGTVTTANSNLDGTGTGVVTILTAGTTGNGYKGCRINSISVKSIGDTTDGMVRIFVQDTGSTKKLLTEVEVRQITHTIKTRSFEGRVVFYDGYCLAPGYNVLATTQNGDDFAITIDSEDWKYS